MDARLRMPQQDPGDSPRLERCPLGQRSLARGQCVVARGRRIVTRRRHIVARRRRIVPRGRRIVARWPRDARMASQRRGWPRDATGGFALEARRS